MACIAAIVVSAVLAAVYEAERPGVTEARKAAILKFVPLRPHQVKRVKIFLFPDEDPHAAGYTLRQSMISIGSGGFSGKGFRKGETNHLKYLPQSISMNDFIFCVYAEEAGFIDLLPLFREKYGEVRCHPLLKLEIAADDGTAAKEMGLTQRCDIRIVTCVEILEDMIKEGL